MENPSFTGNVYSLDTLKAIKQICLDRDVHVHIDGARIFHALTKMGLQPSDLS